MENIKKNLNLILYLIIAIILTIILFWAIGRKEGFHEDEMFSYGASNSTLGNTFLTYAREDYLDSIIKRRNPFLTLKNYIYYKVINKDAYDEEIKKLGTYWLDSVWRTPEDATEYLQIDNFEEAIDFISVYWNTAKDVHPPLFYFAIHIMSIIFWGHFSKYIGFLVNLIFFYGTIYLLRKIFILINKKHLAIPNLILYGASIGAISTVMFQRMYMMLTFFTIWLLYTNLKIYYNNFELTKSLKIELISVVVLGFLTQYNFCFYAVFLAIIMVLLAFFKSKKEKILSYIFQYIKSAIIGVLIFLPCIYHIFFSYRGIGGRPRTFTMLEAFKGLCENVFKAYSLSLKFGILLGISLFVIFVWKFIKTKNKELYIIFVVPTFFTFLMMVIMSPYKSLRYIMFILPIISIIFVILLDDLIENKKFSGILLTIFSIYLSIYGLLTNPINYLYVGYQKYLDIAEEYKNDRFVMISTTEFSQIQDVPEFKIYRESLIVDPNTLNYLETLDEFDNENEFILGIKNWIDKPEEEVLEEVLKYTGFENYELIHTSTKSARETIYRIYR